jgi:hypothetical protein
MKYSPVFTEHYAEVVDFAYHYALGFYDGYHEGLADCPSEWQDLHRHAYKVGYDTGMEAYENKVELNENTDDLPFLELPATFQRG